MQERVMRIPDSLVEKLLQSSGKVSKKQVTGLRRQEIIDKKPLQDLVISNKLLSEEELTKLYAKELDIPFIDFNISDISPKSLKQLSERLARQYKAIVYDIEPAHTLVAMEDPNNPKAISILNKHLGGNLKIHIATTSLIESVLDHYHDLNRNGRIKLIASIINGQDTDKDESDLSEGSLTAKTVNIIIEGAIKSDATDIHIEPRDASVVVRYRVDGLLREVNKLPLKSASALVAYLKQLSSLSHDGRTPQQGLFKLNVDEKVYSLNTATLPTVDGEKVAIHIINENKKPLDTSELGLWGQALAGLKHAIVQPSGVILVSGPIGSGKSTTLHSVLNLLNSPTLNISTIEEPIKYQLNGANQTSVDLSAGDSFSASLQHVLKQDPDIIMISELQDNKTLSLAFKAALKGHLVLSAIHANSAAASLSRLKDMGLEPFVIANTIRAALSQRLIRKLCSGCSEEFMPGPRIVKQLNMAFDLEKQGGFKRLHELERQALSDGLGEGEHVSSSSSSIGRLWRASEDGCDNCNHSGYKGRVGIFEVLNNSAKIQKVIASETNSEMIESEAIKEDMVTMQLDGLVKCLRGLTSIEEVLRNVN
jgi:type IV pilus assembly protein PilB